MAFEATNAALIWKFLAESNDKQCLPSMLATLPLLGSLQVHNYTVGKRYSSLFNNDDDSSMCYIMYITTKRPIIGTFSLWVIYAITIFLPPMSGLLSYFLMLVYISLWAIYVTFLLNCIIWFNFVMFWGGWGIRRLTKFDYFQIYSSYFSDLNLTFWHFLYWNSLQTRI